ncbi:MAG: 50S ribosomal protein L18 [Candidatus Omnitrophica bacterium]|nr:50S ribosomal protein L18 [Candidatus Omnitrophota bacterium]
MKKLRGRELRHKRIKKKMFGTPQRPRLVVYRGLKNLHAQLVDDLNNKTIFSISTNSKAIKGKVSYGGNKKAAASLGEIVAKKSSEKGINTVLFDRSGYKYHGRVKTLAESLVKNGLSFGPKKAQKTKEHSKEK